MSKIVVRILLLVCLAAGGLALGTAPASADFHPACTNGGGLAFTDLEQAGEGVRYLGHVTCPDADVTINVELISLVEGEVAQTGATCAATRESDVCEASEVVAVGPGHYSVEMTFTAVRNENTFTATRTTQWFYAGGGAPVQTCPVFNFPPPFGGCI